MQPIHCPSQRTHRPVPHRASARDLTDCRIRSRDAHPETMVQLCLVMLDVWGDIPQARITHLSPFMSGRCRVVHRGTPFDTAILDLAALYGLLHRANCHNKLLFRNGWFTMSCWFNPYQTISLGSFYNYQISLWNWCAFLFCVEYITMHRDTTSFRERWLHHYWYIAILGLNLSKKRPRPPTRFPFGGLCCCFGQ